MKRFITIFITIILSLSLCACGSVTIGPLTFNFSDRVQSGNSFDAPAASVEVPAADAYEEIAPMEEPEAMYEDYGNFTFTLRSVTCGYFSERGYNRDLSTEPLAPYIFVVFDYEEHTPYTESHRTYSEYVEISGVGAFPQVIPSENPNHFVNNIARYFGFNSSVEHETLEPGTADLMFACYRISDEAYDRIIAGEEYFIRVGESSIPHRGIAEMCLIDELLTSYDMEGYYYEASHAAATFLWSLDFAQYTAKFLSERAEEYGDPWIFGADIDHLPNLYFGGASASPAVAPNLDGEFYLHVGAPEFEPKLVLEVYPELDGIMWDYMDICNQMCNYAIEGNLDGIYECRDILREFYYVMCDMVYMQPLDLY